MIVLGLNYSTYHDSAAAIARDDKILFAIAEERVSRRKHDGGFPRLAIEACLAHTGIRFDEITSVVNGWPPLHRIHANDLRNRISGNLPASQSGFLKQLASSALHSYTEAPERLLERYFPTANVRYRTMQHHHAHAISAYACSGFDRAVVLVIDGRGAWEASSVWLGEGTKLTNLETTRWPNSIGLFYATFTGYLGFEKYADEWKVMGLAPYGKPGVDLSRFIRYGNGNYTVDSKALLGNRNGREYAVIEDLLGPARQPDDPIEQRHMDIAWAVQNMCEEVECDLIAGAVRSTGCRNVCIAGGVGLNSKANGLFLQRGLMDHIFVQPAAGDDGIAIGAALYPAFEAGKRPGEMIECYYGPSYSDEEIKRVLETYKLPYTETVDPCAPTARLLADGKLIGWFQGREEFGPRALGNRSILADPRFPENRDKVNGAVKFRENWRPFAPSVLAEACPDLFQSFYKSPFMILTFQANPEAARKMPAAIHVDNSARVQSVTREQNARYYELISEFDKLTGVPALLNTSFNLKGEAIVNTPFDAIRTFYTSGLDALVMGRFILHKRT